MTLAIVISVVAVFLCGASIGILAVLVAGIRSEDRAQNLTRTPRTRTEAVTRRLLGARTPAGPSSPVRPAGQSLRPVAAQRRRRPVHPGRGRRHGQLHRPVPDG